MVDVVAKRLRAGGAFCVLLLVGGAAQAAGDGVRAVAVGEAHSCALRASGAVECWGRNFSGQLGDGTRRDRTEPAPVIGVDGAQQIALFGARSCAVRRDGALLCWGHVDGVLGAAHGLKLPEAWDTTVAQRVPGIGEVSQVALGADHACVRDREGAVRCWGKNDHGQLGDGSTAARTSPVRVAGLPRASAIALGTAHSCALVEDGGVWCWGANEGGQLGDGTSHDRPRATALKDFAGVAQLVASGASTCARLLNGTARCWGWNSEGQLGDGTRQGHAVPKAVRGLQQIVDLSLGAATACARHADGSVLCWGDHAAQPTASWDETRSLSPLAQKALAHVSALPQAGQVATGHHCVVEADRLVRCWGPNDHGQLGAPGNGPSRVSLAPSPRIGATLTR